MTTRTATICVTPTARESFRVYGTLKTLHGARVIEVHTGFYVSPDLKWQATRGEDGRRWDVSSSCRKINGAEVLTTRREAIEALAAISTPISKGAMMLRISRDIAASRAAAGIKVAS
jgi:hypothetical protein